MTSREGGGAPVEILYDGIKIHFSSWWFSVVNIERIFFQRPRRVGARFTGEDIKPDEYVPENVNFDYDGKRDRYSTELYILYFIW